MGFLLTLLLSISVLNISVLAKKVDLNKLNGVVTDYNTTLQWQDDYNDNSNSIKKLNWQEAITYCEGLALNGFDDWRLPNRNELLSLIDFEKYNPAIKGENNFTNTNSENYWTSNVYDDDNAWIVDFINGKSTNISKLDNYSIRCVRD